MFTLAFEFIYRAHGTLVKSPNLCVNSIILNCFRFGDPLFANCSIEMMEGPLGWLVEPVRKYIPIFFFTYFNENILE